MSDFLRDYEKVTPKEEQKMVNVDNENVTNISFQDMKDYFNSLKESMTAEFRKEMLEYINKQNQKIDEQSKETVEKVVNQQKEE